MNINSLKTKINNKAKKDNLSPQDLMQMYFFERILYRISISDFKYNFIIKGGLLLSSMFDNETRTTQDMDTMIKGIEISEAKLRNLLESILSINTDDNIKFEILSFRRIREENLYGGYRVSLKAILDSLNIMLKIDVTTGDPIIPKEIEYNYKCLIEDETISIMAFSIYTIIAEKFETLIETLETNTRSKDFYDIYKLMTYDIDDSKLQSAIYNTFKHRDKLELLDELYERYNIIKDSIALREYWANYQNKNYYASEIKYEEFSNAVLKIVEIMATLKQTV